MFGNEKNELLQHTVPGTQAHAQETEKELEVEASLGYKASFRFVGCILKDPISETIENLSELQGTLLGEKNSQNTIF